MGCDTPRASAPCAIACQKLGLKPDTALTQVISRDRHADFAQQLALLAASIERTDIAIANSIRTYSREQGTGNRVENLVMSVFSHSFMS
ncbi:hypothetical protein DP113_27105 [Brasilonema octagenarum UFV-E1]|uniref:Uncharacterized protein n=1 Tax=Brasilonema octagenarum UFV-OR1 TaxID=417115 RepID=A0ABX1M3P1_9CYAN|nr:hypothetical protein [Brasilonema octagenarum UFV-OR1]QDL17431.1 hypothetical protein DP113_27105 [Brasilonema octagenarum UFV-E1]